MIRRFAPIESLEDLVQRAREARSAARLDEATDLYRQATREAVRFARPFVVVDCLNALGAMAYQTRDRGRAARRFDLALRLARSSGHDRGEATALMNLGTIAFASGDHRTAITHYRRGRWAYHRARSAAGESRALDTLASVLADVGRSEAAARCRRRARQLTGVYYGTPDPAYDSVDAAAEPALR